MNSHPIRTRVNRHMVFASTSPNSVTLQQLHALMYVISLVSHGVGVTIGVEDELVHVSKEVILQTVYHLVSVWPV